MLIDCHTHAFSEKIAEKAVTQLIDYYKIPTSFGGRLADLLAVSAEAKLDAVILLVAATKPEQVKVANDWILSILSTQKNEESLYSPNNILYPIFEKHKTTKIFPFGAYHLDDPHWFDELQRLKQAGIKGIKLHPEFQNIDLADPGLNPFFEAINDDFILMIHMGDPVVSPGNHSTPRKLAAILQNFPKLKYKIIAAHLGGLYFWEEVYTELAGKDVFMDISSTFSYIKPELLQKIIEKHGTERILFGSDYPLRSPAQDLALLDKINWLSPSDKDKIKGDNCAKLLGIN